MINIYQLKQIIKLQYRDSRFEALRPFFNGDYDATYESWLDKYPDLGWVEQYPASCNCQKPPLSFGPANFGFQVLLLLKVGKVAMLAEGRED